MIIRNPYSQSIKNSYSFKKAVYEYLRWGDDPVQHASAAISELDGDPNSYMLLAGMLISSGEESVSPTVVQSLSALERWRSDDRVNMYARAIESWLKGKPARAAEALRWLTVKYPKDVLSLRVGQALDYFCGDSIATRDRVLEVMPAWQESDEYYFAIQSMLAFGLEENGQLEEAEAAACESLSLEPKDCGAYHVISHVFHMQKRHEDAIAWLSENSAWQSESSLAIHNWWHVGVHFIEMGRPEISLEIYDSHVRLKDHNLQFELCDSASLLWRLQLAGMDVGSRWHELTEAWSPAVSEALTPFYDIHAVMAMTQSNSTELLSKKYLAHSGIPSSRDAHTVSSLATMNVMRGIESFSRGDWASCVRYLQPIQERAYLVGGSHAQRQVIGMTLRLAERNLCALAD